LQLFDLVHLYSMMEVLLVKTDFCLTEKAASATKSPSQTTYIKANPFGM